MRLSKCAIPVRWAAAIAGSLLVATASVGQSPPESRIVVLGLAHNSTSSDPTVTRCLRMALRRQDPKLTVDVTAVEQSAMYFKITEVLDAVALCRAALSASPHDAKLIIAHYIATEAMALLLFGFNYSVFPATDEEALAKLSAIALNDMANGIGAQMTAFFLGSAFEYGVGTPVDRAEAVKWYRRGVDAGDRVSMRELARMLMAGGDVSSRAETARLLLAAVKAGDDYERDLLVTGMGNNLDPGMRLALEQELAKQGLLHETPSGTFDAATIAAIMALQTKK